MKRMQDFVLFIVHPLSNSEARERYNYNVTYDNVRS